MSHSTDKLAGQSAGTPTITQCPKFDWCVMGHDHHGYCSSTHYELIGAISAPSSEAHDDYESDQYGTLKCRVCGLVETFRPKFCSGTPSASEGAQLWGTATSYRDSDTGELLWKLDNVAEECGDSEALIELTAGTFRVGTTVQIYEPNPPCDNCGKPTINRRELCEECRGE